MCEFISWKEIKTADGRTEILFLTHDDIFNTSQGARLRKYTTPDDLTGHGAIAWYYYFPANKGVDRECTDFSSPDNFPPEIVSALKAGKMWGIVDYFPEGLLCAPLYDNYRAKRAPLDAEYRAKRDALDDEYEDKHDALDVDYKSKRDALDADYEAKRGALYADYKAKCALYADYSDKRDALYTEYRAKCAPLDADYEAKCTPLYADYKAKCEALSNEQWGLFTEPKNRAEVWM